MKSQLQERAFSSGSAVKRLLIRTLNERRQKNATYSVRALARDVGLSHTTINGVIEGKVRLSLQNTKKIAGKLRLYERELESLLAEARFEHESDPAIKRILKTQVREMKRAPATTVKITETDLGTLHPFQAILVLESFGLAPDSTLSRKSLLMQTGLQPQVLDPILEILCRLKLVTTISKSGTYQRSSLKWEITSRNHDPFVKSVHLDALEKVKEGIRTISPGERYSTTEFVLLPESKVSEFMDFCYRFTQDLHQIKGNLPSDRVMMVSLHAIPWLRKEQT